MIVVHSTPHSGRTHHDQDGTFTSKQQLIEFQTPSPCSMCTGAILLYKIPRVIIGENTNFKGDEDLLRARGVEVVVVDDEACKMLMSTFVARNEHVSIRIAFSRERSGSR